MLSAEARGQCFELVLSQFYMGHRDWAQGARLEQQALLLTELSPQPCISYVFFYFWGCNLIATFLPSHSCSKPFLIPLPDSFKFMISFFINCYCMHVYICLYIHIAKQNLQSSHNATCMYIFRSDHLILDNLLVCSSLGKTTSPAPRIAQLPIVICVGLRPHGLFPFYGMFVSIILVQLMFMWSYWWDFTCYRFWY